MSIEKSDQWINKFTRAEKHSILEAKAKVVKATRSKYGLFPASYYYWKQRYTTY